MLHIADQSRVSVEAFDEVRARALTMCGLAGVSYRDSHWDMDFTLVRVQQPEHGVFLNLLTRLRVACDVGSRLFQERLRVERSHYGIGLEGEQLLFGQITTFTVMEGAVKYAHQRTGMSLATQKIPEAAPVDDDAHRIDFADWEYEVRGDCVIDDESCALLMRDLAHIAAIE